MDEEILKTMSAKDIAFMRDLYRSMHTRDDLIVIITQQKNRIDALEHQLNRYGELVDASTFTTDRSMLREDADVLWERIQAAKTELCTLKYAPVFSWEHHRRPMIRLTPIDISSLNPLTFPDLKPPGCAHVDFFEGGEEENND